MSINREFYVQEFRVVTYEHANEAVSEPEKEEDFDDLISSIARYHKVYCQQMVSSGLKFAKHTHFKYSYEFQSVLNT